MKKKRILIIDDEANITRLVRLNLEKTGAFEVRAENRAKEGFAAAREFKPDLILLDVVMPDLDGGDVQSQIRSDPSLKNIPIIFLTATVTPEEAGQKGLLSAGQRFLAKPVNTKALIQCIEETLR